MAPSFILRLSLVMAAPSLPTREQELALHRRLVEDDPTAPADLASAYFDYLARYLSRRNNAADDLCLECAGDALIALVKNPKSYNQEKLALAAYLRMSAQGDLKNRLRKEVKHRHFSLNVVKDSDLARNYSETAPDMMVSLREEAGRAQVMLLPALTRGLTDHEVRVLQLLLDGEKKTATFARAMEITDLPKSEQESRVNRLKNKLKRRLERLRRQHDETS
jgi:DNA-directed RNA polymerase specialized sigma24 family protein